MHKSIDDIRNNLQKYINDYTAKIAFWGNVQRVYKKDGSAFAVLSKNFVNCRFYSEFGDTKISVSGRTSTGDYVSDYINIAHTDYKGVKTLEMNADEIETAIQELITKYQLYIADHSEEITMLDDCYNALQAKLDDIHALLNSISGKKPNSRHLSLRYALEDVIKNYYFN